MKKILISFLTFDKDDFRVVSKNNDFILRHRTTSLQDRKLNLRPPERNDLWRPAVAMVQYPDLKFDEYYLYYNANKVSEELLAEIKADIKAASPMTLLHVIRQPFNDPYVYKDVYKELYNLSQDPKFHDSDCRCYVNCTSGTYVMRSCLFALTQEGCFPGVRLEPRPWRSRDERETFSPVGSYEIDDPKTISEIRHNIVIGKPDKTSKRLTLNMGSRNEAFKKLLARIDQTVSTNINGNCIIDPILFTGATGSGKTTIVEIIAEKRWKKKLLRLNCAELRGDPNIAISRLFGHTANAYTGCGPETDGIFKEADGNVLFLDEIGELPKEAQAMLLTAIERRPKKSGYWFSKLGSTKQITSSFRLICGTNRILEDDPDFRKDLLARISTWHFTLPSLAERLEDIEVSAEWPLEQFNDDYKTKAAFEPEAKILFDTFAREWPWTGNFREFNDMIRRMATLSRGRITAQEVNNEIALMKAADEARKARARQATKTPQGVLPDTPAPEPRPTGMELLRQWLGARFDEIPAKSRILGAFLLDACNQPPRLKTQKELAARTEVSEYEVSRWLAACHLTFAKGVISPETAPAPETKRRRE